MPVSNYDEQKKKVEELKQRNKEDYQRARKALEIISQDPNALIVFRQLLKLCGFYKSSVVLNPNTHEACFHSTMYNEGRRAVWLDLRRLMDDKTRMRIESKEIDYDPLREEGKDESKQPTLSGKT